jgi:hypothetical protein
MPKKGSKQREADTGQRQFEPVSDDMVLAAVDRAERHWPHKHAERGVSLGQILPHLGFVRTAWITRNVRPQLEALVSGGVLRTSRRHGVAMWMLTEVGRKRLDTHHKSGDVDELPESPQHRSWREARMLSAAHIDGFGVQLARDLDQAVALVQRDRRVGSDTWFELADRLSRGCRHLGSATYCLYEWDEPDDAGADVDDQEDPGDERLNPSQLRRRQSLRRGRRNTRQWELDDEIDRSVS